MAEYYAVERSPEYLAHYGIRGMKWGVRKAREKGNSRALERHYKKAQKKLAKLNAVADVDKQNAIAKKYGKIAKISGSIGAGAAGLHVGSMHLKKLNTNNFYNKLDDLYNKENPLKFGRYALNEAHRERFIARNAAAKSAHTNYQNVDKAINGAKYVTAGIGAAGLGIGAISGARALAAKRHTTTGGHAAAVAKRDEFKREMDKAFSGTKYSNSGRNRHGRKRRK